MDSKRVDIFQRLILGINYLRLEAENNEAPELAQILENCTQSVYRLAGQHLNAESKALEILDVSMQAALVFQSKYASIRNPSIKEEVLKQIQKEQLSIN